MCQRSSVSSRRPSRDETERSQPFTLLLCFRSIYSSPPSQYPPHFVRSQLRKWHVATLFFAYPFPSVFSHRRCKVRTSCVTACSHLCSTLKFTLPTLILFSISLSVFIVCIDACSLFAPVIIDISLYDLCILGTNYYSQCSTKAVITAELPQQETPVRFRRVNAA